MYEFNEKNKTQKYLSKEIVPLIKTTGIWFEESKILEFTNDDSENFKQFLEDIEPKPLKSNKNIISLRGVINGLPPLVEGIKSLELKIEKFAPIKCIPIDEKDKTFIKGYRSGARSSIVKVKEYSDNEYEKLENKDKLWIIAKHKNKIYIPDDENGDVLIRLKGCGMWTQKNQCKFPCVQLLKRDCYRKDKEDNKEYIEVRGFNSINSAAREINGIREIQPFFDKLNILIGNFPLGFWKYVNLKDDPAENIEKCVCVMKTLGDKRLETHFICGSEILLNKLISTDDCLNLINKINQFYLNKNIQPPSAINKTFKRALNLNLYEISESIKKLRYKFDKSIENFDNILIKEGFINPKEILNFIKKYPELYTMSLIYAEIGYETGKFLSIFHRTGNNWGTFYNEDIRLIDSNAHGDNIIILERQKVKERFKKNKIIQFFSMVDFDQLVRPEIAINVWEGKIKKEPSISTEFYWVELESLCNDLGGIASEKQFFYNIPKRNHPQGVYYNLLYILRDIIIYELMNSYIEPTRDRTFEIENKIDECYDFIEKSFSFTENNEA